MKSIKRLTAIMILAAVTTMGTPQAFAGIMLGDRAGSGGTCNGIMLGDRVGGGTTCNGIMLGDFARIVMTDYAGIMLGD